MATETCIAERGKIKTNNNIDKLPHGSDHHDLMATVARKPPSHRDLSGKMPWSCVLFISLTRETFDCQAIVRSEDPAINHTQTLVMC